MPDAGVCQSERSLRHLLPRLAMIHCTSAEADVCTARSNPSTPPPVARSTTQAAKVRHNYYDTATGSFLVSLRVRATGEWFSIVNGSVNAVRWLLRPRNKTDRAAQLCQWSLAHPRSTVRRPCRRRPASPCWLCQVQSKTHPARPGAESAKGDTIEIAVSRSSDSARPNSWTR
jgi:hypothetical protein